MTPLELLLSEIRDSEMIKSMIIDNIKKKNKKRMSFNITNLIFYFKTNIVEIQDEIGISDERIQKIGINELSSYL